MKHTQKNRRYTFGFTLDLPRDLMLFVVLAVEVMVVVVGLVHLL